MSTRHGVIPQHLNLKLWNKGKRLGIFTSIFLCGKSCTLTKFSEIGFVESKLLQNTIGSDNGSAPHRRQAIIGSIDGLIYQDIYASLASVSSANSEHVRQPIPGRIQWFRFFILYILMILKLHWKKWSFSKYSCQFFTAKVEVNSPNLLRINSPKWPRISTTNYYTCQE